MTHLNKCDCLVQEPAVPTRCKASVTVWLACRRVDVVIARAAAIERDQIVPRTWWNGRWVGVRVRVHVRVPVRA